MTFLYALKGNITLRSSEVSVCGKYLFVTVQVGCENQLLYYVDLEALVQRRGAPDYDWSLVASPHQMYAQLPIITIVNKLEADFEARSLFSFFPFLTTFNYRSDNPEGY